LGFGVERPHIVLQLGKSAIVLKVEVKALEKSRDLENAVATSLDRFDLIVQAFHETTTETVHKVVTECVSQFQFKRVLEHKPEFLAFVRGQISVVFADNPHHTLDLFILGCG
jgi:hypothetical protein